MDRGTNDRAILIPEDGVTHDRTGRATALVVGADNKVSQRTITAARTLGSNWVVDSGLDVGDRQSRKIAGDVALGDTKARGVSKQLATLLQRAAWRVAQAAQLHLLHEDQ